MRRGIASLSRFVVTPTTSKHRIFAWLVPPVLPDHQLIVFARDDDFFFGIVHSRLHEVWSRAPGIGTQLRERESGFRYTPTTCFETFPFPEPTEEQREAIAVAARELDRLRNNWLNPPEWTREEILEFPGSVDGPWGRYIDGSPSSRSLLPEGTSGSKKTLPVDSGPSSIKRSSAAQVPPGRRDLLGTVRYPRLVPKDAECARELKKRTLTNLYNQRPAWLTIAHQKLDAAVFAAYGLPPALTDDELLARLLELNLAR